MLALIFVAILVGVGTVLTGEAGKPFAGLLQSLSAVLLKIVGLVMEATPIGVFALIANAVAANGAAVFVNIGWLALAVVLGSAIQIVLVHSLILRLLARLPVFTFFRGIVDALVVAFSTASSSATLPVAMTVAGRNLGISSSVYSTVLPLGASIGKDGTAMYVGLLSIFSLQAFGAPIDAGVLAIVVLTGALAAFGTAPVPSASLFLLVAALSPRDVRCGNEPLHLVVLLFDRAAARRQRRQGRHRHVCRAAQHIHSAGFRRADRCRGPRDRVADRRARGLRHRPRSVGVALHARRGALGSRRPARTDRADRRLRASVRPVARHDAHGAERQRQSGGRDHRGAVGGRTRSRSEEHTSELQSLMRIAYAGF